MKKRVITGIFYVIVMVGLLAMKIFIPAASDGIRYGSLGVDVLFWAISVIGSYEFLRAVKEVSPVQKWMSIVVCGLMTPVFVAVKYITLRYGEQRYGGLALISLMAVGSVGAMIVASMTVFDHERSNLKSTAYSVLCILYCGALACVGPNVNHLSYNSRPAILFLFLICPLVDTFAFFFGKLFGKLLPYKLAPKTSPNKTIIGCVGGVIGGMVAAMVVWVMCKYLPDKYLSISYAGNFPTWLALVLISIPTSLLAQLGDLFESAIKRGCGIKDMGNILPGHGGILDRFDSMLFASASVAVFFLLMNGL